MTIAKVFSAAALSLTLIFASYTPVVSGDEVYEYPIAEIIKAYRQDTDECVEKIRLLKLERENRYQAYSSAACSNVRSNYKTFKVALDLLTPDKLDKKIFNETVYRVGIIGSNLDYIRIAFAPQLD